MTKEPRAPAQSAGSGPVPAVEPQDALETVDGQASAGAGPVMEDAPAPEMKVALIDLKTGVVVVATEEIARQRVKAGDARRATAQDLEIAGRRDLKPGA